MIKTIIMKDAVCPECGGNQYPCPCGGDRIFQSDTVKAEEIFNFCYHHFSRPRSDERDAIVRKKIQQIIARP